MKEFKCLLFLFLAFTSIMNAQNLKVDDKTYKEQKLRDISTTMERRYEFEFVDRNKKGDLYPVLDLKIDQRFPKRPKEQWYLALYFLSDSPLVYVKGARLLIKFSDKEIMDEMEEQMEELAKECEDIEELAEDSIQLTDSSDLTKEEELRQLEENQAVWENYKRIDYRI